MIKQPRPDRPDQERELAQERRAIAAEIASGGGASSPPETLGVVWPDGAVATEVGCTLDRYADAVRLEDGDLESVYRASAAGCTAALRDVWAAGFAHLDVKADNVIVHGGAVSMFDFGQSERVAALATDAGTQKILTALERCVRDYIAFRNESLDAVFKLYVDGFCECVDGGYQVQKGKPIYLQEHLRDAYAQVCELMRTIQEHFDFKQIFGVNSYCQTWLRNGQPVGAPQFSVMSPHFQTRFYVKDPRSLAEVVGQHGITQQHLQSYRTILELFTCQMQPDCGIPEGQAFVNMDVLCSELDQL